MTHSVIPNTFALCSHHRCSHCVPLNVHHVLLSPRLEVGIGARSNWGSELAKKDVVVVVQFVCIDLLSPRLELGIGARKQDAMSPGRPPQIFLWITIYFALRSETQGGVKVLRM